MALGEQVCVNLTCNSLSGSLVRTEMQENFTIFQMEAKYDYLLGKGWMERNWTSAFYLVGVYLVFIFGVQSWMKTRKRFTLQRLLVIWNFLLAGFSIFGAIRTVPEMLKLLNKQNGFHQSVCSPLGEQSNMFAFWMFLFVLSKAPELGDTLFIVLRKQPLILLHWYHHVTVLLFTWYSCSQYVAPGRWYVVMNFSIHAVMYSYYGLRALKFRMPKPIAIFITSTQILQMVIGVTVNIYALTIKIADVECDVPFDSICWALTMYASYLYLFVDFFQNSYLKKDKAQTVCLENKKMG